MIQYITITIPSYGLMAVIGLIVSICYLYYRLMVCKNELELSIRDFGSLCILSALGCLVGSRLLFFITMIPSLCEEFSLSKAVNYLLFGGFVFYGGLIGAYCGTALFSKIKKHKTIEMFNYVTPAFVLFHIFGRIGCLMAGCCYGFKLNNDLIIGGIHIHYFPIQAIEALFEAIMFILLSKTKMKNNPFKWYILCYASYRFIEEFFRGDTERGFLFWLSTSQWVSLFLLIFTVSYLNLKSKKVRLKK